MKTNDEGPIPQVELGPHLGGVKRLYQRAGVVMNSITMVSAMTSAWATSATVRATFGDSVFAFFGTAALLGIAWVVFDYAVLLPSEQTFNNNQRETPERSPMKRDTEAILRRLDELDAGEE